MTQEHSALVKRNYEKLPREMRKTKDSSFDRIWKYYHNSKTRVELSKEENAIRERLEKAWLFLCRHRTRKDVVGLLMKFYNISSSVAYDDVTNAMVLFGNPKEDLVDAKRAIAETNALRGMDRCWKSGDMLGYMKFNQQYIEINRLDAEPGNDLGRMLKKLKPHQVIIVSSEQELEKQATALQESLINDIEHEIIK